MANPGKYVWNGVKYVLKDIAALPKDMKRVNNFRVGMAGNKDRNFFSGWLKADRMRKGNKPYNTAERTARYASVPVGGAILYGNNSNNGETVAPPIVDENVTVEPTVNSDTPSVPYVGTPVTAHTPLASGYDDSDDGAWRNVRPGQITAAPQAPLDDYENYNAATTAVNPILGSVKIDHSSNRPGGTGSSSKRKTTSTKRPMAKKPGPKKPGPVKGSKRVANPYSKNPFSKNFSPAAFGLRTEAIDRSDANHIAGAAAYQKQEKRTRQAALTAEADRILSMF